MPGTVKISKFGEERVTARYSSKGERDSIISFFNLLYNDLYEGKSYTVTLCPDDSTEAETVAQLSAAGCAYSYLRAGGVPDNVDRPRRAVAS